MFIRKIEIFFIIIFIFFYTGCAGLDENKAGWNNLPDRKFYFTQFQYIHTDKDSKYAFELMRNFPVKQVMYILSKEYNIEVDMSDYYSFIQSGNSDGIITEGLFRNEKFLWRSENNCNNRISIIFEKDYFDESKMKFSLQVTSYNNKLKSLQLDFTRIDYLFKQMDFYISKTDEYITDFNSNNYDTKIFIPGLILTADNRETIKVSNKNDDLKQILQDYVKTLSPQQKKAFKHEMIDHIYKICE